METLQPKSSVLLGIESSMYSVESLAFCCQITYGTLYHVSHQRDLYSSRCNAADVLQCSVASTSVVIHSPTYEPLERYLFSTSSFPRIPSSETLTSFATSDNPEPAATDPSREKRFNPPPASNLPEQFRATLSRLSTLNRDLIPLPSDCSFTIAIELRDENGVEAPIGHPQPWIAAEPELQKGRKGAEEDVRENAQGRKTGKDVGGVRTTPVRSLEAGAFVMEVWVEEGKGKFHATDGINAGQ